MNDLKPLFKIQFSFEGRVYRFAINWTGTKAPAFYLLFYFVNLAVFHTYIFQYLYYYR